MSRSIEDRDIFSKTNPKANFSNYGENVPVYFQHEDSEFGIPASPQRILSTGISKGNYKKVNDTLSLDIGHQSVIEEENQERQSKAIDILADPGFYRQDHWFDKLCEVLFKLRRRKTTVKAEVYYGVIHFISCLYCLAVIPQQLSAAGYQGEQTVVAVALCSGIGSIFSGIFANLPFILAPPTVVSIYLSVFLQEYGRTSKEGNIAVIISGMILMLFGWRPLGRLTARLIPPPIQVGTAVGIGFLTSLAGSTEIGLVKNGKYTILTMGQLDPVICISIFGVVLISVMMFYHIKGSFCLAVVCCSWLWWMYSHQWPSAIAAMPHVDIATLDFIRTDKAPVLTVDLIILYVLYLNGLTTSLGNLAVLTREDATIPRGRWIYILSGVFTVISGMLSSAPILVSPESSAAIKEGAKTGLSAVVCGILFLFSIFLGPLFKETPATGTSPILIMIGIILFQNASRIDWTDISHAVPAYVVMFYIPFTYSVVQGKPRQLIHFIRKFYVDLRFILTLPRGCTGIYRLHSSGTFHGGVI